jgi:hypothetical protein
MPLTSPSVRRLSALLISLAALTAAACVHRASLITQDEAARRIDTGRALNTETVTYQLTRVQLTVDKVVALPNGMLGIRFSYGSASPDCCSVFPRVALQDGSGNPTTSSTDIVIPASDIGPDGTLPMHLWLRGTDRKPSFLIDFRSLGVPTS